MPEPTNLKRTRTRSSAGSARTIQLRTGGTLTLSGSFNFLELADLDRNFIFDMADLMTKYQQGAGVTDKKPQATPPAPAAQTGPPISKATN